MIDSLGSLMAWLAEHSVAAALILTSLQLALVALAAGTASRLCKRSAGLRYSIWLAAVLLALPLLPAHWLVGGWPVAIVQAGPASESDTSSPRPEFDRRVAIDHPHQAMPSHASSHEFNAEPAEETMLPRTAAAPSEDAGSAIESDMQATGQPLLPAIPAADGAVQAPVRAGQIIPWLWMLVVGIYAIGAFSLLLRMLAGAMRLKHLANSGRELGEDASALLQSVAEQMALARTPAARVCPSLTMPLTYGVRRATVLLPADFEAWPDCEQRSVLLHELAHVVRRDTLGQLASKIMHAMYWFHPAGWMIDRQLAVARELATDQRVLQSGISGSRYAEDLVAVIERLSLRTQMKAEPYSCAVSMSASPADFEDRVVHILQSDSAPSLASHLLQRGTLAAMVGLAIATTIRLQLVEAPVALAGSAPAVSEAVDDEKAGTADAQNATPAGPSATGASDLIERVRVKGRVLIDGQPVAGATISIGQVDPIRSPTGRPIGARIAASTTAVTDADGWYVAAVPPGHEYHVYVRSLPGYGDSIHIGFMPEPAVDGVREVKDIELVRGYEEIAGTVLDISGKPVAGANVSVMGTPSANPALWLGNRPETTDAQGRFRLKNIPAGTYQVAASVRGNMMINATAQAKAGEMNLRLTLASEGPSAIPRLQPRKIIDLE